jgi:hypothetical protein
VGFFSNRNNTGIFRVHNKFFKSYDRHIQQEYDKSTETALLEESASYYDEKFGEIDIRTDARHGWT